MWYANEIFAEYTDRDIEFKISHQLVSGNLFYFVRKSFCKTTVFIENYFKITACIGPANNYGPRQCAMEVAA